MKGQQRLAKAVQYKNLEAGGESTPTFLWESIDIAKCLSWIKIHKSPLQRS